MNPKRKSLLEEIAESAGKSRPHSDNIPEREDLSFAEEVLLYMAGKQLNMRDRDSSDFYKRLLARYKKSD